MFVLYNNKSYTAAPHACLLLYVIYCSFQFYVLYCHTLSSSPFSIILTFKDLALSLKIQESTKAGLANLPDMEESCFNFMLILNPQANRN